jgi:hypothetical protein
VRAAPAGKGPTLHSRLQSRSRCCARGADAAAAGDCWPRGHHYLQAQPARPPFARPLSGTPSLSPAWAGGACLQAHPLSTCFTIPLKSPVLHFLESAPPDGTRCYRKNAVHVDREAPELLRTPSWQRARAQRYINPDARPSPQARRWDSMLPMAAGCSRLRRCPWLHPEGWAWGACLRCGPVHRSCSALSGAATAPTAPGPGQPPGSRRRPGSST